MSQMRVVHYIDTENFAGSEYHILELSGALRTQGIAVSVACPPTSALVSKLRAADLKLIPIAGQRPLNARAIRTLRRLLQKGEADLLHAHNGRAALSCAIAARLAGRGCVIASQHFIEPAHLAREGAGARLAGAVHGWVYREADHFLACSQAARAAMLERGDAPSEKVTALPIGISVPDFNHLDAVAVRAELGLADAVPVVVCVARLEREKDIASLIEAMRIVVESCPQAVCLVAGEGGEREKLQEQIHVADLENSVRLLGFYPDVLSLIAAADLFVLPSIAEPFGIVLLEAMALGKATIATRAGGPREIVVDGETGLLVGSCRPDEMASAILRLLADTGLRERMGQAGCARTAKHFTAERMAQTALEVYRKVLASGTDGSVL